MRASSLLMVPALAVQIVSVLSLSCAPSMVVVNDPLADDPTKRHFCYQLDPIIKPVSQVKERDMGEHPRQFNRRLNTPSTRTTSRPINPTSVTSRTTTRATSATTTTTNRSTTPATTTTTTTRTTTPSMTTTTTTRSSTTSTTTTRSSTASTSTTTTSSSTSTIPSATFTTTTTVSSTTSTSTTSTASVIITLTSTTSTSTVTTTTSTTASITTMSTSTTTSRTSTSSTSSTTTAGGACATQTGLFVLQASGSGDFTADGNFAQLQQAFGSGYRLLFSANRQNAQQFKLAADCVSLLTADGGLQAMIGDNGQATLHYQYFFPSTAAASALVNVNWQADQCTINADNTLTCTAGASSIFQITQGDPTLEIGTQNFGETITLNVVPVPAGVFRA